MRLCEQHVTLTVAFRVAIWGRGLLQSRLQRQHQNISNRQAAWFWRVLHPPDFVITTPPPPQKKVGFCNYSIVGGDEEEI